MCVCGGGWGGGGGAITKNIKIIQTREEITLDKADSVSATRSGDVTQHFTHAQSSLPPLYLLTLLANDRFQRRLVSVFADQERTAFNMAQADPRIKKLKIQTGVVKRQVHVLLVLMKVRFPRSLKLKAENLPV